MKDRQKEDRLIFEELRHFAISQMFRMLSNPSLGKFPIIGSSREKAEDILGFINFSASDTHLGEFLKSDNNARIHLPGISNSVLRDLGRPFCITHDNVFLGHSGLEI